MVELKRQERIYWTQDEIEKIAEEVWKRRLNNIQPPILSLVNAAQKQLPENRRRSINAASQVKPVMDILDQKLKDLKNQEKEIEKLQQENQKLKHKIQNLSDEFNRKFSDKEIFHKFAHQIIPMLSIDDIITKFSIEDILKKIEVSDLVGVAAKRLTEKLVDNSSTLVDLIMETTTKPNSSLENTSQQVTSKNRLPKVAVIGLKSSQSKILQSKVENYAQIVFIDKKRETNLPTGCQYYLIWNRFVSHSIYPHVKKVTDPENIINYNGGLENMADTIIKKIEGA